MEVKSQKLEVLSVTRREGTSKKTGAAFSMDVAQCALREGDNCVVGEFILPKGHPPIKPGFFTGTFRFGRDTSGKIGAYVDSLLVAAK